MPGYQKLHETVPRPGHLGRPRLRRRTTPAAEYPKKEESQQVFLDFFGVAEGLAAPQAGRASTTPRSSARPGKRVQVILLDTRYFRSARSRRTQA